MDSPAIAGPASMVHIRRGKKYEGRSFSKRTFFVFFLWMDYFTATLYDRQLWDWGSLIPLKGKPGPGIYYWQRGGGSWITIKRQRGKFYWQSSLAKEAQIRRREIEYMKNLKQEPEIHPADIFVEKVKSITRKRMLAMIKQLEEREKSRRGKAFLLGILNKKCFYTYYGRADDPNLFKIVNECRTRILSRPARGFVSAARSNRFGSARPGT